MMELLVRNAEGNLPVRQREYAAKKFAKLSRYFNKASKVELVHHEQKGKHRLDVTIFADEFTLRGSERDGSLRACIDKVSEKLESRLRKLKHRLVDSHRRRGSKTLPVALTEGSRPQRSVGPEFEKTRIPLKTMTPDEAALQIEMVDALFLAFRDARTGSPHVIYKIRANRYGLAHLDG